MCPDIRIYDQAWKRRESESRIMKINFDKEHIPQIVVESGGYEGVRRIAGKVAEDVCKVAGFRPEVVTEREISSTQIILCATLGKSPMLDALAEAGLFETACLRRADGGKKWEVYRIQMLSFLEASGSDCTISRAEYFSEPISSAAPFKAKLSDETADLLKGVDQILLICGSDKRGTIYGMFSLSEYIGVSPMCYWGDVEPIRRQSLTIGEDIETLSKEPSVKYRGFFINDEWPCFGNWVVSHFGGFNAAAYEYVFELLLRLKGNYLWPAMWSASFPLDGPGSANEELADIYGIVMGYSHHEPCLRASEEWDKVRGEGTRYGNEWNFYTNEQGLLNYWEDALRRSGGYENIITIGMRGERDTSMLGPDATVTENVNLLKRIITKQRELISRYVKRENGEVPMLLALYKEVEPYFYGDGKTPGLKDWDGLDSVTCMLCEDNYGYMRTLPTEEIRGHRGGFGMYYHLDYHGGPVSYEWVDSTPFSRIWEQMSEAYEYGIRDVWIVNVGDLKFHEVSLACFLSLAYDYEKWGYGNPDSYRQYTSEWAAGTFPGASRALQDQIGTVLTEYIRLNSLRRPEALHAGVYHPCHYGETDRMLSAVEAVEATSQHVMEELAPEEKDAYYSMIHFPAMASMNLLKMHLYAGKNHHYAAQGRVAANTYRKLVKECIARDRELSAEWAAFRGGKWSGMELAPHIGFTRWNEDDSRMPVTMEIEPVGKPRMSVSRADEERTATKCYGPLMVVRVPDFMYAGCEKVVLEIANGGLGSFHFEIMVENVQSAAESAGCGLPGEAKTAGILRKESAGSEDTVRSVSATKTPALPRWLSVSPMSGDVEELEKVTLRCDRRLLPEQTQTVRLVVQGGDAQVAVEISGRASMRAAGQTTDGSSESNGVSAKDIPDMIFTGQNGTIVIGADHFCHKKDTEKGSFRIIPEYGKYGCGVKVFPSTAAFTAEEDRPELTYRFLAETAGEYLVELLTAPSNPLVYRQSVSLMVSCGGQEPVRAELIPADFRSGEPGDGRWAQAALDQERKTSLSFRLEAGVQELTVGAQEAGVVLEQIRIRRKDIPVKEAYLGPGESCRAGDVISD